MPGIPHFWEGQAPAEPLVHVNVAAQQSAAADRPPLDAAMNQGDTI